VNCCMQVRFAGAAARAVGLQGVTLSLSTPLTAGEILVIVRNLYPGLGRISPPNRTGELQVFRNHLPLHLEDPVEDVDLLVITTTIPVSSLSYER